MTTWNTLPEIISAARGGNTEAWQTLSAAASDNKIARSALLGMEAEGIQPKMEAPAPIEGFDWPGIIAKVPIVRNIVIGIKDACENAKV